MNPLQDHFQLGMQVRQRKLKEASGGSGSGHGLGTSHATGDNKSKYSNRKYKKVASGISVQWLRRKRKPQR